MNDPTRTQQVLDYVAANPGCTARDIAREVLGGNGDTRTSERTQAHAILGRLVRDGKVREGNFGGPLYGTANVAKRWVVER